MIWYYLAILEGVALACALATIWYDRYSSRRRLEQLRISLNRTIDLQQGIIEEDNRLIVAMLSDSRVSEALKQKKETAVT